MPKHYLADNVLVAAQKRVAWTFDRFPRVYLSFSAGKDSTVMLHLVAAEARRRGRTFGLLFVDLEGQYRCTIEHAEKCFDEYADCTDPYWLALPIALRNAVSVYEPKWECWDVDRRDAWIREPPAQAIVEHDAFPWFRRGMEFEELVPEFGEWYAQGELTACLVGIRSDESLNRYRTIASATKTTLDGHQWTSLVTPNVYNVYPIYDWRTEDLWTWHAHNPDAAYNRLYDLMAMAGLTVHQMRICQPYGDDQRRGLWLFHLIEPQTWARVVARVNGANGGERGYPDGIPDESDPQLEAKRLAPSWRRVCKSLLRNDYWCKGLGFSQHKSDAYTKYKDLMRKRREKWGAESLQLEAPLTPHLFEPETVG